MGLGNWGIPQFWGLSIIGAGWDCSPKDNTGAQFEDPVGILTLAGKAGSWQEYLWVHYGVPR